MADQSEARDFAQSYSESVKEQIVEQTEQAKSKLAEVGRKAGERMEEQRTRAANAIESGAAALHERAESLPGGARVTNIAHAAADKMQQTADYVKEHDATAMLEDVESLIRRYPGQAMALGIVAGFLLGRMFRRSEYSD